MRGLPIVAKPSKKAVNLSIDAALLEDARNSNVNLSATLEAALTAKLRQRRREQWLNEHRRAIDAYNEQIEQHGAFSDALRDF
jgi:antitoxin CcdA